MFDPLYELQRKQLNARFLERVKPPCFFEMT